MRNPRRGKGVNVNIAPFSSRNGALAHSARHDLADAIGIRTAVRSISLFLSGDDCCPRSEMVCSLSFRSEQLQHCVGGVPLKQAQQTCTFTVMVPNASRALALLHAVVMHSGATHTGAGVVASASVSTDHHHITVCARRLPGMMCQPSV